MKRRNFLTLLGAAGLSPALPSVAASSPVAAGYSRYMYGLAVFHARTRATLSAADLMARLKVSAVQADAMLGEMTAKGVITPAVQATAGVMRAVDPHMPSQSDVLRNAARRLSDWVQHEVDQATHDMESETDPDVLPN